MSFNRKHIRAAAMGRVIQAAQKRHRFSAGGKLEFVAPSGASGVSCNKDDAALGAAVRVIITEMLETEKAAQAAEAETVAEATRKRLVVPNG